MLVTKIRELIDYECNGVLKEFAAKTNIPASTVSHWLTKDIKPTYVQIIKICDAFGISADYLLGRENDLTGNIEILGEKLSKDEKRLMDFYRSLSQADKNRFLTIADNIAALASDNKNIDG
ncbi:MAG: helix-turn-helix domain-containing protein [Corallococcus sp.]|nr:helix-turn-helix domain-containing protein [Corallococcus sp.]